jgi:hypothetical protein
MKKYIESIELDFARLVSLQEMTEFVGSNNEKLELFFNQKIHNGFQVSYSAMVCELIVTIARILDNDNNSYGIKALLTQYEASQSIKSELGQLNQNKAKKLLLELQEFKNSDPFKEMQFFRNKALAHSSSKHEIKAGDIKVLFELCDSLERFIAYIGYELEIEFDLSEDTRAFWCSKAKEYWSLSTNN